MRCNHCGFANFRASEKCPNCCFNLKKFSTEKRVLKKEPFALIFETINLESEMALPMEMGSLSDIESKALIGTSPKKKSSDLIGDFELDLSDTKSFLNILNGNLRKKIIAKESRLGTKTIDDESNNK